ncbi:MAG: uroporphyrinogen-III C-methyltransferase [Lachnospirales bacterium]
MNNGFVYIVGAGPGNIDLITKKGYEVIKECNVLIYDRLVDPKLVDCVKNSCKKIYVGKSVGNHTIDQEEINNIIVQEALKNNIVVRLKGGDPFVFGRGGEEILKLKENNIPYKIIPGVTSAIAGLGYAGIPITHRGISRGFHVITGHTNESENTCPNNLDVLAKLNDTLVFLMAMGNLKNIVNGLMKNGKSENTPVAIISNATTYKQFEVRGTLKNILNIAENSQIKAPAILVIGEVAKFNLTDKNILSGVNIGLTGTRSLIERQKNQLEPLGANVIEICDFDIKEIKNNQFIEALKHIGTFSWIVFTSANSIYVTFKNFLNSNIDLRNLGKIKFACVGSGTGEVLKNYGFIADFIPETFSSVELGNGLTKIISSTEKVLIPRATKHTSELTDIFKENNINFSEYEIYDIVLKNRINELDALDFITFSSATSVRELLDTNAKINENCKIVCIGNLSKLELQNNGYTVHKAKASSVAGLVSTIIDLKERKL